MSYSVLKIDADGRSVERVGFDSPDVPLEWLQSAVGGWIECVPFSLSIGGHDVTYTMVLNEEGKLDHLPINQLASMVYDSPWDFIVGDVVLMSDQHPDYDPRYPDAYEPDLYPFNDHDCDLVVDEINRLADNLP